MRNIAAVACAVLAGLFAGAALAQGSAERAAEEARQQAVQPGNNAPLWREVRSGASHSTNAQGVEAGVLIQSRGQTWRKLRPRLALAGGALLAACLGALAAFYLWRGPIAVSTPPTGRRIERFDLLDRVAHWTMGLGFVVLAASGLVLTFGKYLLLPLVGYTLFAWLAVAAKSLHNFVGPLFMLSLPFFIARFVRDNLPARCDLDWLVKLGGMFSGRHVPSGRFNAGEKTLFWGLVCFFSLVLCASGLVLDFPNYGQGRRTMQSAHVIHFATALLAIAASLFHVYLGTLGVKGAYRAMRDGVVDETWAREHHEIWYEEVKAGRSRQHFS